MAELKNVPSEEYLLSQRRLLFLDEWGLYLVLGVLFFTQNYLMMLPVIIFGACAVGYSYKRQWEMEADRFKSGALDE
jgi:hypothetical protein